MKLRIRKIKRLITPLLVIIVALSSICTSVHAVNNDKPQEGEKKIWSWYFKGRNVGESFIESKITGITYPYHIYLPASYANNSDRNYPIIYVMDGQWNFKGYAYSMERDNREVIVVAIEQGGTEGSNRRMVDYSLPGAIPYLDFFRQEFLPLIESTYRINGNNRTFQGTSISGVVTTALLFLDDHERPLFKNFIAYDPAYWHNPKQMQTLIEKRLQINNRIESNLYITTAFPFFSNHFPVMDFIENLEDYAISGLNIHHESYLVSHNNIFGASLDDTLALIYGKPK